MANQMSGKVCIVTGANSGIGLAVAKMFTVRGASVVLCGRNQERLKIAVDQCVRLSGNHHERFLTFAGDNNRQDVRKAIVDATVKKFGRLDVVVASAGIFPQNGSVLSCTEETYDRIMNINVKAIAFLIQLAVPHLERTQGNIVLISSFLSTLEISPDNIYAISKAAIDHLTRCLVLDLSPKGIRINAVRPSFIPTGITRERGGDPTEVGQAFTQIESPKHPLYGRLVTVDAIAESVMFLASNSATFITGQCLLVDGGRCSSGHVRA